MFFRIDSWCHLVIAGHCRAEHVLRAKDGEGNGFALATVDEHGAVAFDLGRQRSTSHKRGDRGPVVRVRRLRFAVQACQLQAGVGGRARAQFACRLLGAETKLTVGNVERQVDASKKSAQRPVPHLAGEEAGG